MWPAQEAAAGRQLGCGSGSVIRIDAMWLAVAPSTCALAPIGCSRAWCRSWCRKAHHGYLFANARANRIKLVVHDGFGVWCAARRLNTGSFEWPRGGAADIAVT